MLLDYRKGELRPVHDVKPQKAKRNVKNAGIGGNISEIGFDNAKEEEEDWEYDMNNLSPLEINYDS